MNTSTVCSSSISSISSKQVQYISIIRIAIIRTLVYSDQTKSHTWLHACENKAEISKMEEHPAKRKKVVLSIEQKLKIIELLKKDTSYTIISEKYGIGRSTVSDILRKVNRS